MGDTVYVGLGGGFAGFILNEHCANKGEVYTQSIPHFFTQCFYLKPSCGSRLDNRPRQWGFRDNSKPQGSHEIEGAFLKFPVARLYSKQ